MRVWRRRIVRSLVALAALAALGAIVGIAVPWGIMANRRHRIVEAIRSAEAVRLEEFSGGDGKVIARRDLSPSEKATLIRIAPAVVPRFPLSLRLCFVPHHRVVARAADGSEFILTICFGCGQAQHDGSDIYDMPPAGNAAMRKFFEENGIQVRSLEKYGTMPAASFAADPERQLAKQLKYSDVIQDLISPNEPPVSQNGSSGRVEFPAGYDVAAQRRINDVRQTLHDNFEESLPYLIAALDDRRYCMTINWADGDGFYNKSVGAICRNIIESQLEVYRDKIEFSGPKHWHKYDYTPISWEWWQTRRDRKLFELQIEAVEWAIQRFEKDDNSDPRFDPEKQLSDLRALRDSMAQDRKPTKSQPMHRMATSDVGTAQ